ncbi:MAG: sulfite exporter TauE/SafE family protein [Bacteroidota bacterium]
MLYTAFIMGLFGSLHCVGMCGPIAMALPVQNQDRFSMVTKLLLYNFGRTVTYVFLGVLIGLLGEGLFLAGMQKWLSIGLGIFLLVIVLFSINIESRLLRTPIIGRVFLFVKNTLGKLLKNSSAPALFRTGVVNGFLPCGLVYMAIVGAVSMGSLVDSALYMFLFGVGTIPLMLLTATAGHLASIQFRNKIKKLFPVFITALAVLLIYRGIRFDLPEDFSFWEMMQNMPMCH